jgi:3D (Asp-Asp-Asp) domain-containing protein
MRNYLRVIVVSSLSVLGASCACQQPAKTTRQASISQRIRHVRTTAYTHAERGGRHTAVGTRLCGGKVMSAAADWSRWPLGTRFRIVDTDEVFQVDDYGTALIGTGTIDLYKTNRLAMNRWGVRAVDIDILEWGSPERSLDVLAPRARNRHVRAMIVALSKKPNEQITRPF